MNKAQNNVIQTSAKAREKVEEFLDIFEKSRNPSAARAKEALRRVISSGISALDNPIANVAKLINQLTPELFGGPAITPEQAGGVKIPKQPSTRRIDPRIPDTFKGMHMVDNNTVEINTGGFRQTYKTDAPEVTGKMVPVRSSNVHSIGFQFNLKNPAGSMLLVRYLQGGAGGQPRTKGPLYGYRDVHPRLFAEFMAAASKGIFVWDELRIRGTVAGSQYRYTLMGIVADNVPRRAVIIDGIQHLKQRARVSPDGTRRVRSHLPDAIIGPYRPTSSRPNTGNPNRASPNRGR